MTEGNEVTLIADRGEILNRTLVSVENDIYFVCKREEYHNNRLQTYESKRDINS